MMHLLPTQELSLEQLKSEYRTINTIPSRLKRRLRSRLPTSSLMKEAKEFTLGKGHMTFFYDKGGYLENRWYDIRNEFHIMDYRPKDHRYLRFPTKIFPKKLYGFWSPDQELIELMREILND